MIKKFLNHLINLPGWHTDRKIVVFESDDWGSQRMPNNETRHFLETEGILPEPGKFDLFDSLEQDEDLELLFETIAKYKDEKGNHPIFTALCNVVNPDFTKIKDSKFKQYYYRTLSDQIEGDVKRSQVVKLWKQGHENRVFTPEFHGREHLNVTAWLRALKRSAPKTSVAFEHEYTGINARAINESKVEYQAAFDFEERNDLAFQKESIKDGLAIFEKFNQRKAEYFVPTNGPFHPDLDTTLYEMGIDFVMRAKWHKVPKGNGQYSHTINYLGKKLSNRLICIPRNNYFEPTLNKDAISNCIKLVGEAFKFKRPSIISTHRVNYIGSLSKENRGQGLKQLNNLVKQLLHLYPDVEFLSSVELGRLIKEKT